MGGADHDVAARAVAVGGQRADAVVVERDAEVAEWAVAGEGGARCDGGGEARDEEEDLVWFGLVWEWGLDLDSFLL